MGYSKGMSSNASAKKVITAGLLATAAVMLSACDGGATQSSPDTIPVTKITATAAPAPAAEQAPMPSPTIPRTSDRYAEVDKVVRDTAADAKMMWERATGVKLPSLTVVPEGDPRGTHCLNDDTLTRAWACDDGTIVYRPAMLDELMRTSDTKIGPVMVTIAHEVGHIGQAANGFGAGEDSPREELAADCSSGAYMRYVVEGKSTKGFTSTRDGALAAALQTYPLDGSYMPVEDAKKALAHYREGFDSGQLCIG